jgi:hypothetical protein
MSNDGVADCRRTVRPRPPPEFSISSNSTKIHYFRTALVKKMV